MRPRAFALTCTVFAMPVWSSTARADSAADEAQAAILLRRGQNALQVQDFTHAEEQCELADKLVRTPATRFCVAYAKVRLGKLLAAREIYLALAKDCKSSSPLTPFCQDVGKELGDLEPRIPSLVITVKGAQGPQVTVDGEAVRPESLGVNLPVDPGNHVVRATAKGFLPGENVAHAAEGTVHQVVLELEPVVEAPGPEGPRPSDTQRTLGFASIGLGAAGIIVGAVTAGLFWRNDAALSSVCTSDSQGKFDCTGKQAYPGEPIEDTISDRKRFGIASTVGFIGGGVFAAGGLALVLLAPRLEAKQGAWVRPDVGMGYLGIRGVF